MERHNEAQMRTMKRTASLNDRWELSREPEKTRGRRTEMERPPRAQRPLQRRQGAFQDAKTFKWSRQKKSPAWPKPLPAGLVQRPGSLFGALARGETCMCCN